MDSFNAANAVTCNYTYDDLGRVSQIDCGAGNWGQTYTYDSFGNISWAPLSGHTGSQFLPVYDTSKNRFSSFGSYDANGNLTSDGLHTYAWDADGNLSQLDGATAMVYDAFGRRVEQTNSSGTAEILYGPNGSKLALMSGQTVTKAFVPLPGGMTAVYTGSTLAWYRHPDWLGSSRLASTPGGGVSYDGAYAPFGETEAESGTSDRSFTGQNQDLTANLYDFPYREYNPLHGRWISPDPAGAAAADPASPQSWNRYAYVNGSPLDSVDPSGLTPKCRHTSDCIEAILHSEQNTDLGVYGSAMLWGTMLGVPVTLWSPTSSTPSASPAPAGADQEAILVTFVNSDGSVLGLDSTTWLNPPGIGPPDFYSFAVELGPLAYSFSWVRSTRNGYYSMGGGTGSGVSLTAGWVRGAPNGFLGGPSVNGCGFYGVGLCAGKSLSGETALQAGVGIGGWGAAAGSGIDPVQTLKDTVLSHPAGPLATKVGSVYMVDESTFWLSSIP